MIAAVMARYHDARVRLGQWMRAEGKHLEDHATPRAAAWRARLTKAWRMAEGGYRGRRQARASGKGEQP